MTSKLLTQSPVASLPQFAMQVQFLGHTSLLQTTWEAHKRLRMLFSEPLSIDGLKKYFPFHKYSGNGYSRSMARKESPGS